MVVLKSFAIGVSLSNKPCPVIAGAIYGNDKYCPNQRNPTNATTAKRMRTL